MPLKRGRETSVRKGKTYSLRPQISVYEAVLSQILSTLTKYLNNINIYSTNYAYYENIFHDKYNDTYLVP